MAIDLNKTELRELVRDLIQKELGSNDFKKSTKDIITKEIKDKNILDEKEIRNLIRQTLVNFYKLMYQRQSFWSNGI